MTRASGRGRPNPFVALLAATAGAASILATMSPAEATAQLPSRVSVVLTGGSVDGRGGLPNAPILSASTNVVTYQELGATAALGVGVDLRWGDAPVGLRMSAIRSFGHSETGVWGCAPDAGGNPTPCPSILIEVPTDLTATIATASLVADVPLWAAMLHPAVGVGAIRSGFSWDPSPVGAFSLETGSFTDHAAVLQLALGLSVPVGRIHILGEYAHFVTNDDVARVGRTGSAMVGVSVPL